MDLMPIFQWMQHHVILLMFAVFVLVVIVTYWPGRRTEFEHAGRIPLDDDR
jgi:cbb3-type cytochrome oxidase subunit 3